MTSSPDSDGGVADPGLLLLDVSECDDFDYISDNEGAESWAWPASGTEKLALPQAQFPLSQPTNDVKDVIHPGGDVNGMLLGVNCCYGDHVHVDFPVILFLLGSSWSRGRGVITSGLVPVEVSV